MSWSEKVVVFDLDGTLVDTAPDLHAALRYAFASESLESVDLPTVRSAIGHGARAMIQRSADITGTAVSETLLDTLHAKFLEYYQTHIADLSKPFDGIIETLELCRDRQASIAVCTNKTQRLAEQLLTEIGLSEFFSVIVGADRTSDKKPSPTHLRETISLVQGRDQNAVMIGDSSSDGLSAQAAGIPFIFMTYGYPDHQTDALRPFATLSSARDLPAAIQHCFS